MKSPEYVKELVQYHVGGCLKIAPDNTRAGPAVQDDEAGHWQPDRFKFGCSRSSAEAGKKQFLIPYFIAAHPAPATRDMNSAIWLKKNGFAPTRCKPSYPSPMATATAMYHLGRNLSN